MSFRQLFSTVLLVSAATGVSAAPITVQWTGTLGGNPDYEPASIASRIANGDTISGQFSFDTNAAFVPSMSFGANYSGDGDTIGHYLHDASIGSYSATINNDVTFGSDPSDTQIYYQVLNDHTLGIDPDGMDRFGFWSRDVNTNFSGTSVAPRNFQMFFNDHSGTLLDDISLAGSADNLSAFSDIRGEISTSSSDADESFFMTFSVDSFSVIRHDNQPVAVPEPATLSLFMLGLAGLVARHRRR
ncbi:PEP-CTERM sorting domain-containing protein [Marinobacter sp. SS13-12]|uniref:PEP-CTERM sorting domain-containing protein n=1 Tax=Marinobacter sp. SS13-12 TaxID=3050451 RepID=UPI002556AF93|nr:PEP-CTERM sorting domain-containing protein [Marinobacter sp. SS13-12]MDK8462659.1 PEP-CTERM sorting domain-containing protein [Marinobacter sp. SS13-12]